MFFEYRGILCCTPFTGVPQAVHLVCGLLCIEIGNDLS